MKRREALSNLSLIAGGSLMVPAAIFSGCKSDDYQYEFFSGKDIELLEEIGETILPETPDSPGAKTAKVAHFMDTYVANCYTHKNQQIIKEGLVQFRKNCKESTGKAFTSLSPEAQHNFLVMLDKESKEQQRPSSSGQMPHYFTLLKSLVLFGYFTSEEGANNTLRYVPVPGKYVGDYPFKQGDKAWAL